jgi:arginine repressor
MLEEHLSQAEQHIALGERHIARQREIVAELERDGHDITEATRLLTLFEETQLLHLTDRDRIQRELL